jgi:hypothetical protein
MEMAFASPEDRFGIKLRGRPTTTLEQNFSMVAGSVYVVGGIIGFFITGFTNVTEMTNHAMFGVFMLKSGRRQLASPCERLGAADLW